MDEDELITTPSQVNTPVAGPIITPGEELGTQPVTSVPPTDISLQSSYRGPTDAGARRATGMRGGIDARAAQFQQQDAVATGAFAQQYNTGIEGQQQALGLGAQVRDEFDTEMKRIEDQRQAIFKEAARQEEQARQEAKISTAEFNKSYQEQLAAIRGLSVNIAGPLASLSDGEMGGLSLALFAQGFLAAKGININVSQQVDRWVERSIREQERKIEQKQQGLQQSINMWQLARQASADDLEARQRYRGWVIEGLKSQTELAASRYQSGLANAQAAVSISKLDADAAITRNELLNQHHSRTLQNKQYETETAYKLAQVNLEQQELNLKKRQMEQKKSEQPKFQVITDPSTGKATWIVREDRINAAKDAEIAAQAARDYGKIEDQIKRAINFRKKIKGEFGHGWIDKLDDVKREYEAMVTTIATETSRGLFGLNATDKEFERISRLVPFNKWYEEGDNDNIWANFRENARNAFDHTMLQHADAIPKELQTTTPRNTANPGAKAEYEVRQQGQAPVEKLASIEEAKVVAKDSDNIEQSYGSKLFGHFNKFWRKQAIEKAGYDESYFNMAYDNKPGDFSKAKMKGHSVAIDHLVNAYLNPETVKEFGDKDEIYKGTKNYSPEELKKDSYRALQQLASGKTADGRQVPQEAERYADFIISLSEDELRRAWETDPDKQTTSSRRATGEPLLEELKLK